MGISAELIATLIQTVAVPELLRWLKSKQSAGEVIDDAAIMAKLNLDMDTIIARGKQWLDAHPE